MAPAPDRLAAARTAIQQSQFTAAERLCRGHVHDNPADADGWHLLGVAQQLSGQPADATASYERALSLDPNFAEVLNNLALMRLGQGNPTEACSLLQKAIALQPTCADYYNNLGNALQATEQLPSAISAYARAIAPRPDYLDAHHNLGNALRANGSFTEALACYDRALAINPNIPQVHLSRGLALLQQGDFERGWPEYEWRLKCPGHTIPPIPRPLWDGSPLNGRSILLYADQGFGDSLQFIRYATLTQARGGRVVVASPKPLARLIATHPAVSQVISEGEPLTGFDLYVPVTSLSGIFQTRLETIPNQVPYLRPAPELVSRWHQSLTPLPGFKIGIAWQGNPKFGRDRSRSFRLEQFEPISRIPNVQLISLQRGFGSEQISPLAARLPVIDLGNQPQDFMDTAAIIQNLDLMITPDTALAHLAGALAVPTWVALPHAPDWRWLIDRDDSPWYPSIRLFRQSQPGDWPGVFARMAAELKNQLSLQERPQRS